MLSSATNSKVGAAFVFRAGGAFELILPVFEFSSTAGFFACTRCLVALDTFNGSGIAPNKVALWLVLSDRRLESLTWSWSFPLALSEGGLSGATLAVRLKKGVMENVDFSPIRADPCLPFLAAGRSPGVPIMVSASICAAIRLRGFPTRVVGFIDADTRLDLP